MHAILQLLAFMSRFLLKLRVFLKKKLSVLGPVTIIPYRGYGSPDHVYLKGRVVENKPIAPPQETLSSLQDYINMYRRFTRMPIPGVRVRADFHEESKEAVTDNQGYFQMDFRTSEKQSGPMWQRVKYSLQDSSVSEERHTDGEILVLPEHARHVVISDIDDTVLPTHATSFLKMMRSIYLGKARTRLPFPGVSSFYRALHLGPDDKPLSPILYVSRGPWNLYEILDEFFTLHGIPVGPVLFLRDWGLSREGLSSASPRGHKFQLIKTMLRVYSELDFILIGDSGQKDPEIYTEVINAHPGRVKGVYIREVTGDPDRIRALEVLSKKIQEVGSTLVVAEDTRAMATHAAEQGWIEPERLKEIVAEKVAAEEPPPVL